MSIKPVMMPCALSVSTRENPTTGFSTESCFLWLHDKNVEFGTNIRGSVNYEYNRLLAEKGLVAHSIPGGEDFGQLGMDRTTRIVRPDLYLQACQKAMSNFTHTPFSGLNISTAVFFNLLDKENVKCSANVRGLINQRYNQLLLEAGICEGKIPGNDLHQLGMDTETPLRADLYAKAYGQVIANFEPTAPYSHCGPLQILDLFRCTAKFMGCADIFRLPQVCKLWNTFSEDPFIWHQLFKAEKIPFVESVEGQKRNYKQDFRILFPITISGSMIERLFGEMIGEIPCISAQCFEQLSQIDPFAENGETMGQTFVFVVVPHLIRRTSGKEFPCVLDKENNLIEKQADDSGLTEQELLIPFSVRNLKVLCSYPLSRQENMPVFGYVHPEVSEQCKPCSDKMSLCFMRRDICCRGMSYAAQKDIVEKFGFQVTSLGVRALFDAVCILTSGTCPDAEVPRVSYARTPTTIDEGGDVYQVVIGDFAPGSGARVCHDYCDDDDRIGVVPGVPAEVPRPLEFGTLALDKGH